VVKLVCLSFNLSLSISFINLLSELEVTMARSFVRSANLHTLVFKTQSPEVIQNCQPMFQKLINPQLQDSLQTDMRVLSSLVEGGDDDDDGSDDDDDGGDDCVMSLNERTT
jgi:hypothetical protein